MHLVVVLLAHAPQNSLLLAWFLSVFPDVRAHLFLGTVCNASAALHADLPAAWHFTALPRGTMGGAEPCLLNVLGASGSGADLALSTVSNAQAPLDDAVGAGREGTLAAGRFAFELRVLVGGGDGGGGADRLEGDEQR